MTPERSVRFGGKKRTVSRTMRRLMRRHLDKGFTTRGDLVAIVWPKGAREPSEVRHHKGAFQVGAW
jgi:hypothetical protein